MRKFIFTILVFLPLVSAAQKFQPHFYAGLSLPKHSYTPSGEIPKLRFNPGITVGTLLAASMAHYNQLSYLIGINYSQKGGIRSYKDGHVYTTRFNVLAMEYGIITNHADASLWGLFTPGFSLTVAYLLDGRETFLFNGANINRKLDIGTRAPYDLFHFSFGFKGHVMVNIGPHFDLGLCYQGSFNELDLINKNNLRDRGFFITIGYWIHRAE
ncbi:MAG: hypothetical protein ACRCYO_11910 [Bacteroidia bacterium]